MTPYDTTPVQFWVDTAVKVLVAAFSAGLLFALPGLIHVWQSGSLGDLDDYQSALAFFLAGTGMFVVQLLTQVTGTKNSGSFTL